MGVAFEGDLWDIFAQKLPAPEGTLPVAVILTLPAAGSDASADAVLSYQDQKNRL